MNFIEEIAKFDLIKGSDAYEMAKLEVLLRMDKVYVAVRGGSIAVFTSKFTSKKSIYVYTNKELIAENGDVYEEISLAKLDIILRNKGNNFNSCIVNHETEYCLEISANIPYFIRRYGEIFNKSPEANEKISPVCEAEEKGTLLPERVYIAAREARDIDNIDFFTRESGKELYAYLFTSSSQGNNSIFKDALYGCKLAGLDWKHFIQKTLPDLKEIKVTKIAVNYGTKGCRILDLEELEQ